MDPMLANVVSPYPVDRINNERSRGMLIMGQGTGAIATVTGNGAWDPRQPGPNPIGYPPPDYLFQRPQEINNRCSESMIVIGQGSGARAYCSETAAMALAQQTMPVMETMPTHNSQSTEQQLCLGQERYQAQQAWTFMLLVQTLAQRVLDVEQREMRVEQREMEFKQREEQRESYFNQQQRALQQVLKQQKADFIQWERERDQRESDFKQQQREHQQHEKVLKQQGADLIQRETKLEQLETELKQQESALEKAQRQASDNGQVNGSGQCQVLVDRTDQITPVSKQMLPASNPTSEPDVPVTAPSEAPTAPVSEPDNAVQPTSGMPKTIRTRIVSLFSRKGKVSRKAKVT